MNTIKSISVMKSFDFQCDFSFDFAWQQDEGSFVLCADTGNRSLPFQAGIG